MTQNVRNSRSALAAEFAATNPWLGDGESRIETDTRKVKTGPGYWNVLGYDVGAESGASVLPDRLILQLEADFTVPNGGGGTVLFDSLASITGTSLAWVIGSPGVVTVGEAGVYAAYGDVKYPNGFVGEAWARININSGLDNGALTTPLAAVYAEAASVAVNYVRPQPHMQPWPLEAGDTLSLYSFHDQPGPIDVNAQLQVIRLA